MNKANDKLLDIIGLTDAQYLREAEEQPAVIHRKRRFSAGFIAAAAAAAVMTVTAGAVTAVTLLHRESVELYYNEEMVSEMEQRGYAVGQVTENEHVRLTLENLVVDENYAYGVVTAEYLDSAGRNACGSVPVPILFDSKGLNAYYLGAGSDKVNVMLGRIVNGINYSNEDKQAYTLQIYLHDPFSESKAALPDDLTVRFVEDGLLPNGSDEIVTAEDIPESVLDGLRFEISTKPNTTTYHLVSDDGHKGVVSEFMLDFTYRQGEVSTDGNDFPDMMTLRFSDGREQELHSSHYRSQGDFNPEVRSLGNAKEDSEMRGRFCRFIDLTGLEEIEFAGITYKVI